jgi:multiple sugar transport system permease protein
MATIADVRRTQPLSFFNTRRGRILIENLQAYTFLFPAALLIFIFGLFPVAFAFFVSLHRWRRFPGEYQALDHYTRALGDFAYVFFFWLALGAFVYAALQLYRQWQQDKRGLLALLPAAFNATALLLFVDWFARLLTPILNIPQRIRGQEATQGLFISELVASFQFPEVASAGSMMLIAILAAAAVSGVWLWWSRQREGAGALFHMTAALFLAACGVLILQLTASAIQSAVTEAQTSGGLAGWTQVLIISAGVGALGLAWWLWTQAGKRDSDRRFVLQLAAAAMLAAAGYVLIAEVPRVLASADPDLLSGFGITVMFVIGTVPLQLGFGLALAYMLFQNIKGKAFFRIAYFLPYIMPFVATSIVFNILFSHRSTSPINQLFASLGFPIQKWLLEPTGVFSLLFGAGVPEWLAGPGLALVVIIIYSVWTYIGYCTVVFLAGLGTISQELYEAARIDGASGWAVFRYITLPLLSPTTFFLTLIAVIGTFQAFTQIWIMRTPAAAGSVDTVGVYIFETVLSTDPNMGYGSALSLVLFVVILVLTLVQNRIAKERVFYG